MHGRSFKEWLADRRILFLKLREIRVLSRFERMVRGALRFEDRELHSKLTNGLQMGLQNP